MDKKKPRAAGLLEGADNLSLGVSIVVAVLIGIGVGILMRDSFGYDWLLWVGVFWGVSGAILNVYKAYSKQMKVYEELAKEPRYAIKKQLEEDDEDDEDYGEKKY